MTPAHHTVFVLAGSPVQNQCEDMPSGCRVCGHDGLRTMPYGRWQGQTFTDQNKLRDWSSDRVCEPCVWSHAWNPPPGVECPPGKKGPNLRLYSHTYDAETGYWHGNKANKARLREWLLRPKRGPWWAAIADSGQKHVLPWTPCNLGDGVEGRVRFEETTVRVRSASLGIVDAMCGLLTAGATKAEILGGNYTPRAYQIARDAVLAFEGQWSGERGGDWFALALWLAQRDEEAVAARQAAEKEAKKNAVGRGRKRRAARPDGASRAVPAGGVPAQRSEPAEALGPDTRADAAGDEHHDQRGRVGDDAEPRAETVDARQLDLFGG